MHLISGAKIVELSQFYSRLCYKSKYELFFLAVFMLLLSVGKVSEMKATFDARETFSPILTLVMSFNFKISTVGHENFTK